MGEVEVLIPFGGVVVVVFFAHLRTHLVAPAALLLLSLPHCTFLTLCLCHLRASPLTP